MPDERTTEGRPDHEDETVSEVGDTNPSTSDQDQEGESPDDSTDGQAPEGDARPSNREARYRRELRATEAERDALAEQVNSLRRDAVERIASERLREPATMWKLGTKVEDLLDADGNLDRDAIKAAVDAAVQAGLAPSNNGARSPREGRTPPPATDRFEQAFAPRM